VGWRLPRGCEVKIAVTAQDGTLQAPVDPRFGRARCFVVVDTDTGDFEVVDNEQNLNAAQGAGIQAGRTIANAGAEVLITGHCGPKAFRTLSAAGIRVVVGAEGTVAEALQKFEDGDLPPAEGSDVEGHWM
jgi:predicted Fe-Mo cluster-binding NifX family protein